MIKKLFIVLTFISLGTLQSMKRSPTSMANLHRQETSAPTAVPSGQPNPEYATIITTRDINNYPLLSLIASGANFATWQTIHNTVQCETVPLIELIALRDTITRTPWVALSPNNSSRLLDSINAALEKHYSHEQQFNVVIMWPPAHPELDPETEQQTAILSPSLPAPSVLSADLSATTFAELIAPGR